MWLPHGLAADVTAAQLASRVSVCRLSASGTTCEPLSVTDPKLVNKGTLRISVPRLDQNQARYRIRVSASPQLRDAFGLPLQASENVFYTVPLARAFSGPTAGGWQANNLLLIEPSTRGLDWPIVSRGPSEGATSASAWQLGPDDVASAVTMINGGNDFLAASAFGTPQDTVSGPKRTPQRRLILRRQEAAGDTGSFTSDASAVLPCNAGDQVHLPLAIFHVPPTERQARPAGDRHVLQARTCTHGQGCMGTRQASDATDHQRIAAVSG